MRSRFASPFSLCLFGLTLLAVATGRGIAEDAKPVLETLLKSTMEGVEGREIVVSRVTLPPGAILPKHWHPGEEFAYILEGSSVLKQMGKPDVEGKAGDLVKIPYKQVHTGVAGPEGVKLIVFRVHETGKPERVLVE